MRILSAAVYSYSLPLVRPLATGSADDVRREGFLLKVSAEQGHTGWGEASPLPGFSREDLPTVSKELRECSLSLPGRDMPEAPGRFHPALVACLDGLTLSPSVRFAAESALLTMTAAAEGRSLSEFLGADAAVSSIPVNALLDPSSGDYMAAAEQAVSEGFRTLKIKVGRLPPAREAALVARASGLEGVKLRLDANRAWDMNGALDFAARIAGCPVEYIEEPLRDSRDLPVFIEKSGFPAAYDETLASLDPGDADRLAGAAALVLKPSILGGIVRTLEWAAAAEKIGALPVVSGLFETGIGTGVLAALAASTGGGDVDAGLDTYRRLGEDVLRRRIPFQGGRIVMESLRGSSVDEAKLEAIHRG